MPISPRLFAEQRKHLHALWDALGLGDRVVRVLHDRGWAPGFDWANSHRERALPGSVLRGLTEDEMAVYRPPFVNPGKDRRPTLSWPRQIPIDGEPAGVVKRVEAYAAWLSQSAVPKLFVNAEPGSILTGRAREFCRGWPNQTEVTVAGSHLIQEDSPDEIGAAVAAFVRRLRGVAA